MARDTDRVLGRFSGEEFEVELVGKRVRYRGEGFDVSFEAETRDALDTVGKAKHVRFVIDKDRQKQRLEAKAAKVKAQG